MQVCSGNKKRVRRIPVPQPKLPNCCTHNTKLHLLDVACATQKVHERAGKTLSINNCDGTKLNSNQIVATA